MQKDLKEGLVSESKPIREGMNNLPKAITFPQFLSITASDDDDEEEVEVFIGVCFHLWHWKTFGLWAKDGKFYIGNKKEKIKENNIIVGDKEYIGTPGLFELIVATTPDENIFTNGDYDNYAEIMHSTNALRKQWRKWN